MAERYEGIRVKKDKDGKRYVPPVLYPNIPYDPKDIYVRSVTGDRLDLLAHQFYKNVSYWWIIAYANNIGKGTMIIPPNSQVRIPADPIKIQKMFKDANQIK